MHTYTAPRTAMPLNTIKRLGYNTAAYDIWKVQSQYGEGGDRGAFYREHVPVTPLQVIPPAALPKDLHDTKHKLAVKRDDLMPGGAYKLRGAVAALDDVRQNKPLVREVAVASTGNFATEAAIAALALGFEQVHAYVPADASPAKCWNIRRYGATIHAGGVLAEAVERGQRHGEAPDAVFMHPYDDLHVVAAHGTATEEVERQLTALGLSLENVIMKFGAGGGGLAAGNAVATRMRLPGAQFHIAQAEDAAAIVTKYHGRTFDAKLFDTTCDGAAVMNPGQLPLEVLLDETFVHQAEVMSRGQIGEVMAYFPYAEPAGALALASALQHMRSNPRGSDTIVAHVSGGNATNAKVAEFMGYAQEEGYLTPEKAFDVMARAHLHREVFGLEEVIARGRNGLLAGTLTASGPSARIV